MSTAKIMSDLDVSERRLPHFYNDEVAAAVKAPTSIMDPVMIMFVGGIAGVTVVSMQLPLFTVYSSIK